MITEIFDNFYKAIFVKQRYKFILTGLDEQHTYAIKYVVVKKDETITNQTIKHEINHVEEVTSYQIGSGELNGYNGEYRIEIEIYDYINVNYTKIITLSGIKLDSEISFNGVVSYSTTWTNQPIDLLIGIKYDASKIVSKLYKSRLKVC